jgi:hypothetical protein
MIDYTVLPYGTLIVRRVDPVTGAFEFQNVLPGATPGHRPIEFSRSPYFALDLTWFLLFQGLPK